MKNKDLKDINGKIIQFGHILAVRYIWSSYVGVFRPQGLCAEGAERHAFFSPHSYEKSATYQILGHVDNSHDDYNDAVYNWYTKQNGECPIKINVYKNKQTNFS